MNKTIKLKIDGKIIPAEEGQTIVQAAHSNGILHPNLMQF